MPHSLRPLAIVVSLALAFPALAASPSAKTAAKPAAKPATTTTAAPHLSNARRSPLLDESEPVRNTGLP